MISAKQNKTKMPVWFLCLVKQTLYYLTNFGNKKWNEKRQVWNELRVEQEEKYKFALEKNSMQTHQFIFRKGTQWNQHCQGHWQQHNTATSSYYPLDIVKFCLKQVWIITGNIFIHVRTWAASAWESFN